MILFMDGFSHYQTSDILRKWTSKNDAFNIWTINPGEGRSGGCVKKTCTSNQINGYLLKGPEVSQAGPWAVTDRGIVGFAVKVDDLSKIQNGPENPSAVVLAGTLIGIEYGPWGSQAGLALNQDGTLSLYANGFPVLATSVAVASNGNWMYVEMKWQLHISTGSCVVRVNNVEVINYSGPLLSGAAFSGGPRPAALWSSLKLLNTKSGTTPYLVMRMCDLYISDWNAPNGNFLGDVAVKYIVPDAAGFNTLWTPTPAVPNWQNVNEVPPNDDVSFNETLTIGNKDTYSFQPVTVSPLGIQHCVCARRTAPGAATLQAINRQGGVDLLSVAQAVANETYKYNLFPYDVNPATGIKWTQTEMNAGEFGVNKET